MSRFVLDLVIYYACAFSAEAGTLPADDAMECSRAYEQAKTHFYVAEPAPEGSAARFAQSAAAFATFRAWEAANPARVDALKAMARDWGKNGPAV